MADEMLRCVLPGFTVSQTWCAAVNRRTCPFNELQIYRMYTQEIISLFWQQLLKLRNYNSLMAVVGGLTHSSMARLHKTLSHLSSDNQRVRVWCSNVVIYGFLWRFVGCTIDTIQTIYTAQIIYTCTVQTIDTVQTIYTVQNTVCARILQPLVLYGTVDGILSSSEEKPHLMGVRCSVGDEQQYVYTEHY